MSCPSRHGGSHQENAAKSWTPAFAHRRQPKGLDVKSPEGAACKSLGQRPKTRTNQIYKPHRGEMEQVGNRELV